ncbi:putative methyltransferase YcgJ [Anaerohalosphaera lusitana]|uniref:Putative methyltransferase YcgJ n=1 Tax=Anaerohalosphaera lusitana TaxID=1936003 RepID=A0A1U9NR24_9BACT|nr:class I SAM-dependent methyltransferase [Anaerohalosphaera lusitana]AQT70275.1 putative methyltransferase YcgJ [Anaerohalosphaera lusitana]
MFNNFVNRHDFTRFLWGLRHGYGRTILRRLTKGKVGRVKEAWKKKKRRATAWWELPAINRRINKCMTGDENIGQYIYLSRKYFSDKKGLRGLSLGCGKGSRERIWAGLVDFEYLEGFDISDDSIKTAKEEATIAGLDRVLRYRTADIYTVDIPEKTYDVIFVDHALHHFSPLEPLIQKISSSLKNDGLFIVNEYVGPTRFQWTDRQLELANHLRGMFPEEYRKHDIDGSIKKVIKPSRLSMIMKDPSEAIESENIMPLLKKYFDFAEYRPCAGAILHLAFEGIGGNFLNEDETTKKLFEMSFCLEDTLTEIGEVGSDYALVVCQKRKSI